MMSQVSVLLVDDEPALLEGLQVFLEDEGYDVHLSANGNEALSVFREVYPELVIMDLRMPGMPGVEVIRRMRELKQDTVVIILTGYGCLEAAVEAIRLNVFDFISKPIDLDQFKAILDRARDGMEKVKKARMETDCVREQLVLAESQLDLHRKDMEKLESFAVAGRLIAGVLHNLNNPLSYILGEAQILQMVHPEMKVFEKIEQQACRMSQIIDSFLGKVKASKERQAEQVNLNQILIEEVSFLESHPYFRGDLRKEWRLAHDLPPFQGVAADLTQVFGNILFNAAEALNGKAVKKLVIGTAHDESEITVTVEDNGPGIPCELQDRIFEPFFTTKSSKTGIPGSFGRGLGLYSCRQILEGYGGTIKVTSNPGQGTRFTMFLPKNA